MIVTPYLVSRRLGSRDVLIAPVRDIPGIDRLPFSLRIVLENLVWQCAVRASCSWAVRGVPIPMKRVFS